jgi:hypothetical protein
MQEVSHDQLAERLKVDDNANREYTVKVELCTAPHISLSLSILGKLVFLCSI